MARKYIRHKLVPPTKRKKLLHIKHHKKLARRYRKWYGNSWKKHKARMPTNDKFYTLQKLAEKQKRKDIISAMETLRDFNNKIIKRGEKYLPREKIFSFIKAEMKRWEVDKIIKTLQRFANEQNRKDCVLTRRELVALLILKTKPTPPSRA